MLILVPLDALDRPQDSPMDSPAVVGDALGTDRPSDSAAIVEAAHRMVAVVRETADTAIRAAAEADAERKGRGRWARLNGRGK